ncbi:hypothetical protein LPJ59_002784 [Coemansia sp. RSA 2399]|nr:hypothetical protein LPJ59_002784 [Coemansia sp. RSA 2399]
MSSYHRITSLLNASGSENAESEQCNTPAAPEGNGNTQGYAAPGSVPANDRTDNRNVERSGSGSGLPRSYPSETPTHTLPVHPIPIFLQTPSVLSLSPSTPAAIAGSQRVVRQQPVYASNDYRYWPYEAQILPSEAPPAQHRPSSLSAVPDPHPQALTHSLIQQHMETMYPGVMFDYSFHIRQRRTRACINCHAKKIKCEGSGPECTSCTSIGIKCRWRPMKKRGPKPKNKEEWTEKKEQKEKPAPLAANKMDVATNSVEETCLGNSDGEPGSSHIPARPTPIAAAPVLSEAPLNYPNMASVHSNQFSSAESESTDKNDPMETLRRFYSDEVTEETRDAVTYYFDYFYGTSPIFHPAMFLRRLVAGNVDPMLIDAMRVTTARIIATKTGKTFDFESLAAKIHQNIFARIHNATPDYIRAIVLMGSYNGGEGDLLMYNSLTQLAVSLVIRYGWNTLDIDKRKRALSWEEWVALEIKRRIFWFVHVMDSYQSLVGSRAGTIGDNRLFTSAPGSDESWDDVTVTQCGTWPNNFNPYETDIDVVKKASLSHVFQDLCNIATMAANVNEFLWNFGISLKTTSTSDDLTPNIKYLQRPNKHALSFAAPISSAFECEEFRRLNHDVKRWRDSMMRSEDLKSDWEPSYPFAEFGSHKHRLHVMRWRYFCYYGYGTFLFFILHLSNRPSFFSKPTDDGSSDEPQIQAADTVEDNAIRELFASVFSKPIYDNLFAYDVVKDSWDLCLEAAFDYVKFLDRNSDMPLERYDQIMPLSTFIAITVLVRHIRTLRQDIKNADSYANIGSSNIRQARGDFIECVHALRRLWTLLLDLGAVWKVKGMEILLRTMQVEEMTNTTELLSDMLL